MSDAPFAATLRPRITVRLRIPARERRNILNKYVIKHSLQRGFYVELDAVLAEMLEQDMGTRVPIQYLHEQLLDKQTDFYHKWRAVPI